MNLLVTGAWNYTEAEIKKLKDLGHEIYELKNEKDMLPCHYEKVEGVICNGLFLYHDIEKFTNLKYIQLTSAGFDRVPMDYVKAHDIKINNARGVYSIPMAEFAVCGVLQLYKQSRFFYENQKRHNWEKHRGIAELNGKNVLIVGCGSVGNECAKRFSVFGCRVSGIDLYPRKDALYEEIYPLSELENLLKDADITVLTLPLTDETVHLIGKNEFEKMKDGAVLVNIARGKIVDTKELIKALDKKLSGAVSDVFEEEPLSKESPLWNIDNVILTPHNSFVGDGNIKRLNDVIFSNLEVNL